MLNDAGHMWFGGAYMWFFWLAIIGFFIWLANTKWSEKKDSSSNLSPKEILEQRYARGELNLAEFEEKRSELEKG